MINKGFTLIELVIAIAVGSLIMLAVYGTVNMSQHSSSSIERRVIAQQDVRGALDLMALEIRMASYNQSLDNTIWRAPNCISASANPTYKGIQAATANSITIEMDIFDTSKIPPPVPAPQPFGQNSNEIITYTYSAANLLVSRSTNCGPALSFIGDTAASGRRVVRVINDLNASNAYEAGVDVPIFRYFDFQNNEILPASLPAAIPNIRTIEISLVVETENIDPTTNIRKKLVYSTRVIPRNHGANP
jgi:prepilin-type N-terminal cleavage/methylation domain-containing protein